MYWIWYYLVIIYSTFNIKEFRASNSKSGTLIGPVCCLSVCLLSAGNAEGKNLKARLLSLSEKTAKWTLLYIPTDTRTMKKQNYVW